MTLENTRLQLQLFADLVTALDLSPGAKAPLAFNYQQALANGTGSGQADRIWFDQRTLAASATENLDLAGVLTDAFGATFSPARVKALVIAAAAGNTNNVLVGGHATAAWATWAGDVTDKLVVRPGGMIALCAPDATAYAVTATTADMLKIENSAAGTSVTYDVIILGSSA